VRVTKDGLCNLAQQVYLEALQVACEWIEVAEEEGVLVDPCNQVPPLLDPSHGAPGRHVSGRRKWTVGAKARGRVPASNLRRCRARRGGEGRRHPHCRERVVERLIRGSAAARCYGRSEHDDRQTERRTQRSHRYSPILFANPTAASAAATTASSGRPTPRPRSADLARDALASRSACARAIWRSRSAWSRMSAGASPVRSSRTTPIACRKSPSASSTPIRRCTARNRASVVVKSSNTGVEPVLRARREPSARS